MFKIISDFETAIAKFYNAPYAIAVDSCTHGIELSLRLQGIKESSCPTHTYISIPFTFNKLNIKWEFKELLWKDYYYLGNTNIIDAAVLWKENSYISNTFMCLSFQYKKHLSLGRAGMILVNDLNAYTELKKMSYDGRTFDIPWGDQNISSMGYHYYMTPETAQLGLDKLQTAIDTVPRQWTYQDYPYLPKMKVFNV